MLALLLIAAADWSGWHASLVAGAGTAQGILGGHFEVRDGRLAAFVGTGVIFSTTLDFESYGGEGAGAVAGGRWYGSESGEGPFLSAQFSFSAQQSPGDPLEGYPPAWLHQNATTLVAGWRFRSEAGLLLEVGLGGGVLVKNFGGSRAVSAIPDLTLALGYEF